MSKYETNASIKVRAQERTGSRISGFAFRASSRQGSMLIYSLLIMATVLAIGLSLTSIFLNNLRSVGQARESVVALYAADAGAELCLYEARSGADISNSTLVFQEEALFILTNIADQTIITDDCNALGSASFGFRSTGTFRRSSRALEISQ